MVIKSKRFWNEIGIKVLSFLSFYKGLNISEEEIYDFVFEEEFLDEDAIETYGSTLVNYGKLWDLMKTKILESKWSQEEEKWAFTAEVYRQIYLLIDEKGTYLENLSSENPLGEEILKILTYLENKMFKIHSLEALVEYMLIIYIYFLNTQPFGEFTMEFAWCIGNSILLFKELGPIFPAYNEELFMWIEKWNKLAEQCKSLKITDYSTAPLFEPCFKKLIDASESSKAIYLIS